MPGSLNFVFRPDDALRDAWRRWFQYTFTGAAPLDRATVEIPQGEAVPADKRDRVLDDIRQRLTRALATRIAPRPLYNRISAPDLTETAPAENWNQPLSLL